MSSSGRVSPSTNSRSSDQQPAREAPYLTHRERFHGQLTLTAPPNLGRQRKPEKRKKQGKYEVPEHIVDAVVNAGLPSHRSSSEPASSPPIASTSQTSLVTPPSTSTAATNSPPTARRRRRRPAASPATSTLSLPATLNLERVEEAVQNANGGSLARVDSDNASMHADRRIDIWADIDEEGANEPPPPAWSASAEPDRPPIPSSPPPNYRSPSPSPSSSRAASPDMIEYRSLPSEWEQDRLAGLTLAERIERERGRRRESMRAHAMPDEEVEQPERAVPTRQSTIYVPVTLLLAEEPEVEVKEVSEEEQEATGRMASPVMEHPTIVEPRSKSDESPAASGSRSTAEATVACEPEAPEPSSTPPSFRMSSLFGSAFAIPAFSPEVVAQVQSPKAAERGASDAETATKEANERPEEADIDQDVPLSMQGRSAPNELEIRRRREGHRASLILSRPMSIKRQPPPVPPPRRWVPPTVIREEESASRSNPYRQMPLRPTPSSLAYIPPDEAAELTEPIEPSSAGPSVHSLVDRFEAASRRRPPPPPPRPSVAATHDPAAFAGPAVPPSLPDRPHSTRELPRPPGGPAGIRSAFEELQSRSAAPTARRPQASPAVRPSSPRPLQQQASSPPAVPPRPRQPSIPSLRPITTPSTSVTLPTPVSAEPPSIPSPPLSSLPDPAPIPTTTAPPPALLPLSQWTDLDLLAARTDHRPRPSRSPSPRPEGEEGEEVEAEAEEEDEAAPQQSTYEPLLLLGEVLGPPPPRATEWERERISVAPIDCIRRRVKKDGTRMQKLACVGLPVSRCVVCQVQFKEGNQAGIFPHCLHTFHIACLERWLNRSRCCPTCRRDITDDTEPSIAT